MLGIMMNLVNRYKSCWGLTLFKWNQLKIELWYCPARFVIEEHSHPSEDIELIFLYGEALFVRCKPGSTKDYYYAIWPQDVCRRFTINAGDNHYFKVTHKPLLFLNIERWLPGHKPTSAAIDFKLKD